MHQVSFCDQSELILDTESKFVVFRNNQGEQFSFQLHFALDRELYPETHPMSKRMNYMKLALSHKQIQKDPHHKKAVQKAAATAGSAESQIE